MQILCHGYVAGECGTVPVNGDSAEVGIIPDNRDSVEVLEGLDEVVCVLFSIVLDAKVVSNEGEKYGLGVVF